jgi:hypothetical protein
VNWTLLTLTISNGGSGPLIADAVYITSSALYNDGSPAPQVNLGAFDGILLQRQQPVAAPTSSVNAVCERREFSACHCVCRLRFNCGNRLFRFIAIMGLPGFSGNKLPTSLNGVSVTIDGKQAHVEYISPTQINAFAPDDDTIGQVTVQVTTPQGVSYAGTVLKRRFSPISPERRAT